MWYTFAKDARGVPVQSSTKLMAKKLGFDTVQSIYPDKFNPEDKRPICHLLIVNTDDVDPENRTRLAGGEARKVRRQIERATELLKQNERDGVYKAPIRESHCVLIHDIDTFIANYNGVKRASNSPYKVKQCHDCGIVRQKKDGSQM